MKPRNTLTVNRLDTPLLFAFARCVQALSQLDTSNRLRVLGVLARFYNFTGAP